MKILVIGGAGYVGSVLTRELLNQDFEVRILDNLYYTDMGISDIKSNIELVVADMRTVDPRIFDGIEAVINVGGLSNDPLAENNPRANFEINTLATEHTAWLSKKAGVKRYVYASSCSIYDLGVIDSDYTSLATEEERVDPKVIYSISKYEAEQRLLKLTDSDFSPIVLRKGTIFGFSPRMRYDLVVNTFVKDALSKDVITVFHGGEMWRPLIDIKDVVSGYIGCIKAEESEVNGQIFNLAYKNFRISELALRVQQALEEIDIKPQVVVDYKDGGVRNYRVCSKKIQKTLGVEPQVSITESVKDIVSKIQEYGYVDFDDPKYYNIRWMKLLEAKEREKFTYSAKI